MLHVSWSIGLNGLELKIQIKTDILLVLTWVQTVSCADPGIFVRGGPGLKVIKLEYKLKLKIKHNDWLLADTCPQAANHCALF